MLVSILSADSSISVYALFQDSLGEENKVEKILRFHYLICMLLPVLKRMNHDRSVELETEAITNGSDDDSPLIDVLCLTLSSFSDVSVCNREENFRSSYQGV